MAPDVEAITGEWTLNASDDLAVRDGCWFSIAHGERVCRFIEEFCHLSQGRWAGRNAQAHGLAARVRHEAFWVASSRWDSPIPSGLFAGGKKERQESVPIGHRAVPFAGRWRSGARDLHLRMRPGSSRHHLHRIMPDD